MKILGKQIEDDQQIKPVRQGTNIGLNSKSLEDVGSYPYPMRSQEIKQALPPEYDAVDLEEPALSTLRSQELQMPTVIFVYPTRGERQHLENVRLERQVQNWENEGGRP
jgi:hypothetical protein